MEQSGTEVLAPVPATGTVSAATTGNVFVDKTFGDVYLLHPDGGKEGPGTLTLHEREVTWKPEAAPVTTNGMGNGHQNETQGGTTEWRKGFEEINLHAIGSDGLSADEDKDGAYVLVQYGEGNDEIRFLRLKHDDVVSAMYEEFCQGIIRCPLPDDEEDDGDGDMFGTAEAAAVLGHLDSRIIDETGMQHHGEISADDNDARYADAEEASDDTDKEKDDKIGG